MFLMSEVPRSERRSRRQPSSDAVLGVGFKNNHFTEMCCGTEAGSYLRLIDSCATQLKAQGPSSTCNESNEDDRADRPREMLFWRARI